MRHSHLVFRGTRKAFSLIELMVVMGIMAFLAAMVMLIAPSVLDHDRARDAATQVQGSLQNARLRAMRDGMPRGVRLLIDPTSTGTAFSTSSSYQYIEVPPWLILSGNGSTNPYLQFQYTMTSGQVTGRSCTINNLTAAQLAQIMAIVNNNEMSLPPTLGLPTLNFWTTIVPGSCTSSSKAAPYTCSISLSLYPDAALGASTNWVAFAGNNTTAYWGIYQAPRPLLGEPTVLMPLNTTIDLSDGVSMPSFTAVGGNQKNGATSYDILFSPSGQMMVPYGVSQVFLWIRDPSKGNAGQGQIANNPAAGNTYTSGNPFYSISPLSLGGSVNPWSCYNNTYIDMLTVGGEQMLVSIKGSSGATGVSPIYWPTAAPLTPYSYAQQAANSP